MLNCSVVYTEAAFILVYLLLDKHLYLSVLYLCSKIKGLNLSVCIDLNNFSNHPNDFDIIFVHGTLLFK